MLRIALVVAVACAGLPAQAQSGPAPDLMALAQGFVLHDDVEPRPDPSNRLQGQPLAEALGGQLFFDAGLSADGQTACATCHVTEGAFVPNESRRAGAERAFRTVMPVAGAAQQRFFNWDGGKDSLWSQALVPLEHPDEHGLTRTEVVAYVLRHHAGQMAALDAGLTADAALLQDLPPASPLGTAAQRQAWDSLDPSLRMRVNQVFVLVGKAIAAFEASLPPPVAAWDRMVAAAAGRADRMPQEVLRGFAVFTGKGRCSTCHTGPFFTDGDFHNTGLPAVEGQPVDMGRQAVIGRLKRDEFNCLGPHSDAPPDACKDLMYMAQSMERTLGTFRTPTLRGVALRGPFGHAGQMPALADMIDHYDRAPLGPHGRMVGKPTLSELVPLNLTEQEKADLIAFLNAL
ncbi:MAG: hypothetical protein RIR62_255 [Pseudomonadota bacterium]